MCKVVDTGHSIKTSGLGFSARTPKRKSGECGGDGGGGGGGSFSCITRAGQHSSVPIEQAWLLQPRTMPRYCTRALLFHRFVPFSFDPRMRYIPRVFNRPNLPMACPSVDLFLSLIFLSLVSLSPRHSCTPYFALLSIILDRRRCCSRHRRRIDFRLPRSRHRPSQS